MKFASQSDAKPRKIHDSNRQKQASYAIESDHAPMPDKARFKKKAECALALDKFLFRHNYALQITA